MSIAQHRISIPLLALMVLAGHTAGAWGAEIGAVLTFSGLAYGASAVADSAEAWYDKGVALVALGRSEEALSCSDRALEINPDLAEVWYNKSAALHHLRRYPEARQCFEKAAQLGDQDASRALDIVRREGY